ncbi:MAG: PAS domain S-box protein [Pseudomonadota bacterium]
MDGKTEADQGSVNAMDESPDRMKKTGQKTNRSKTGPATRLSDERYRAFIENISEGVYETDIHGNFLYFNNSLCEVFGYPKEEIQWQNFSKFMDEEHRRAALDIFNQIYQTGQGFSDLSWEIIDKESHKRIIELSASLILNREGEKIGFRGIARDVTEKIKAQEALRESELRYQCQYEASREAERRYRTLLDFVPYPMVVFTLDGRVDYLNPAFSETFGWTLDELEGQLIPYVPPQLQEEARESIKRLFQEKMIQRFETRRLTKEGRILDVILRGAVYSGNDGEPGGELVILRDITREKRMARNNEALLRVSQALPEYPDLGDLLDYVSEEIKRLMNTDGALVILLDQEKRELFFQGAAYDDSDTQRKAKKIRYPFDRTMAAKVIKSGKPIIVSDTSKDPSFYSIVDDRLGFHTKNLLQVPLRSSDRIIGVLCAINKKEGAFDQTDVELLNMIEGTIALSIENARFSDEIREAYREVTSLNRAKDKVINHLSHELKTPVSVLLASLNILEKRLSDSPEEKWRATIDRARRNLDRILEIQYQVEDIMRDKQYKSHEILHLLLEQCKDELESLIAEEVGEGPIIERIEKRIEEIYGPKGAEKEEIQLHRFVEKRIEELKPRFSHRKVEITPHIEPVTAVCIPEDALGKVVDGLLRNAIENTPDEGKIKVIVRPLGEGSVFVVDDCGIGITEDNQRRIFEGFFTTHETMAYSSKRPFDFNAGGKGADLLRMKIFGERYNFKLNMESSRCRFIPKESDVCPGKISECRHCKDKSDCFASGGTNFTVYFPPIPKPGCLQTGPLAENPS